MAENIDPLVRIEFSNVVVKHLSYASTVSGVTGCSGLNIGPG